MIGGHASFGVIPREHWDQPDWIDDEKAKNARVRMAGLPYGGALPIWAS